MSFLIEGKETFPPSKRPIFYAIKKSSSSSKERKIHKVFLQCAGEPGSRLFNKTQKESLENSIMRAKSRELVAGESEHRQKVKSQLGELLERTARC